MTSPASPRLPLFRRLWLWPVVLLGAATFGRGLALLLPLLLRDNRHSGDVAQHTWWLYRYSDPSLFPGSLAAKYFSLPFLSPPAYRWLAAPAVKVMDAQHFVETLAILLALAAVVLTAVIGHHVGRRAGAGAALIVLWMSQYQLLVEGGFPRSFGLVLVLSGMLALLKRKWAALGGVVLATVLMYPPVVMNLLAPTAAVVLLVYVFRRQRPTMGFYLFLALSAAAGVVLLMTYLRPLPPEIGRPYVYAEMVRMPEWQYNGRFRLLGFPPEKGYFDATNSGIGLSVNETAFAAVGLLLTAVFLRRAISLEAWALLIGALTLWALAHLLLFRLYFPNRYVMYALPVFGALWAAGAARELRDRVPSLVARRLIPAGVILFSIFAIVGAARDGYAAYYTPFRWAPPAGYEAALAYLGELPKETLVAAHPDDANSVPLRSRRDVLVNTEIALPMHSNYYAEMKRRTNDVFDLLYATDWDTVNRIAEHNKIDVFLLDTRRLRNPDLFPPYQPPFRRENQRRIADGREKGFALLSAPPERVLFESGDVMVLQLSRP